MKIIPLTQGKRTKVNNADYRWLKKFSWHAKQPNREFDIWYAARCKRINGVPTTFYMHRQIMKGSAGKEVHHKNGNTLDNRRKNLELLTKKQNLYRRN